MKIELPSTTNKWLLVLFVILISNTIYSQCVTGSSSQDFCAIDNSTINDIVVSGITILWYDAPTGGNLLDPANQLANGVTYYAEEQDISCVDPLRLAVTTSIFGEPPTGVNVFVGICAIDNATIADLSATGANIAWYDAQTGGNLYSPTDPLVDGAQYWVQQTENGCTSERLPTTVTIINPPPPTVVQDQSFCSPPLPTVNDLQSSDPNVDWYATETSTTPLNSGDLLIDGEGYWASQTIFPCESTVRVVVNVTIDPAPDAGTNGTIEICEEDTVTLNLFDQLGGTPDSTGAWTGPSTLSGGYLGTFDPAVNADGVYTYSVSSTGTSGVCPDEISTVTTTIIIVPPPVVSETTQTFCLNDFIPGVPTVGDLVATGSGVQWYDTETDTTPLNSSDPLVDGEDYWASTTDSGAGCESDIRVVVTVLIVNPPPPVISNTNQTFCLIDFAPNQPTVADLVATGTGIQWYDNETDTTPLNTTDNLIDGEDYWASTTDAVTGCQSIPRLVVNVNLIDPLPPTTTDTTQTFCSVDFVPNQPTVADLVATGTGIQWYDTETDTTPLNSTDNLIDGEDYWASTTDTASGCESSVRLVVTVNIIDPPPPTTSETTQTFCLNDFIPGVPTVGDLTVTGTGIQWYDTETDTTPLNSTDPLIDGEDYWATETDAASGCESSVRLVVNVIIVNPPPPVISDTNQTFCLVDFAPNLPTVADLVATGTGILWYDNETDTTPLNATDDLIDGEDYWASTTDSTTGCESIPRLVLNVTFIDPLPPTTSETTQTFCSIDFVPNGPTVNDLTATGITISWYDTETDTTPLNLSDLLVDGEDYWASETDTASGCESSVRLVVTVIIVDPPPPTTTDANQTFCSIDFLPSGPTVADISATGTTISWYDTETSTTPLNSTDLLVDGEDYWATETAATSSCESATRLVVTISIIDPPPPTVSNINQAFCVVDNPTIADLNATGGTITWYDTDTSTTPLNSTDTLIDGEDYWASNTDATSGCESTLKTQVTVTINDIAPPTTSQQTQTFCGSDNPTIADLDITGSTIVWYDSEAGSTALNSGDPLIDGEDYWAAQTDAASGCESSVRLVITVILTDAGTPTIDPTNTVFCELDIIAPTINDLNNNLNTNGGVITWYDSYPNGTVLNLNELLVDGTTYYAIETDINGCSSTIPSAITVTFDCDTNVYDIEIYDGFSPNNDGRNETFIIKDINVLYPGYSIEIFNRWGNSVFKGSRTNFWNGEKDGNGEQLSTGVYYFILHFNKDNRKSEQHRLYLSR